MSDLPPPTRRALAAAAKPGSGMQMLQGAIIAIAVLYFARELLIPLVLAVLLSFVLAPLVRGLRRISVPRAASVLVGASGAIAGLMGASSRLIERRGFLAPFTSKSVMGMAAAWVAANLAIALVGLDLGTGNAPIAWEAHLIGYAVGLLLIGPLAWALKRWSERRTRS